MYHERQRQQLCALHALNNLFQDENAFSKGILDEICLQLSPDAFINPHRSVLGLGNYDINVIIQAINTKQCEVVWFDKRREVDQLVPSEVIGFILNLPTDFSLGFLSLPFRRKHWVTIRSVDDIYYNFDSKLSTPEIIGDEDKMLSYLKTELSKKDVEMMIVLSKEVHGLKAWMKNQGSEDVNPMVESS